MNANDLLQQMLEEAIEVGATSIELEREPEGLEVSYMVGDTGFGRLISDRRAESALFRLIFKLADLEERERGTMEVELQGKPRTIHVQQYESFGETCLRLFLQEPQRGKKRRR
jgi:hypothetical protein